MGALLILMLGSENSNFELGLMIVYESYAKHSGQLHLRFDDAIVSCKTYY